MFIKMRTFSKYGLFALVALLAPLLCSSEEPGEETPVPDLSQIIQESVVLIKCKKPHGITRGSGFIAMVDGTPCVVTNQHVVAGAQALNIRNVGGKTFKSLGTWAVSPYQDLAMLGVELDESERDSLPLELSRETPDIESSLVILGDNGGADVVTMSKGKTQGIGGRKIEFDADVVPGCSGGPILLDGGSFKVCGVVVSVHKDTTTWINEDTRFNKKRRFGERIPPDEEWKNVPWNSYHSQARKLMDYELFIDDCGNTLTYFNADIDVAHEIDMANYSSAKQGRRALGFYKAVKEAYDATVHEYKPNALFSLRKAFADLENDFNKINSSLRNTQWKTHYLTKEAKRIAALLHYAERHRSHWEMKTANIIKEVRSDIKKQRAAHRQEVEIIVCPYALCTQNKGRAKPGYHARRSVRCPSCGRRATAYYYWK